MTLQQDLPTDDLLRLGQLVSGGAVLSQLRARFYRSLRQKLHELMLQGLLRAGLGMWGPLSQQGLQM
jgi:hypothetical protein